MVAPLGVMLIALATDRHHVGASLYGAMVVMVPAGLLVGSLVAPRVADHPRALVMSLLGVGAALAPVGSVPLVAVFGLLVLVGVALAVANTVLLTTIQRSVPATVQGRVFGVLGSLSLVLRPLGLVLATPLLGAAGVAGAYAVVGIGVLGAGIWAKPARRVGPLTRYRDAPSCS